MKTKEKNFYSLHIATIILSLFFIFSISNKSHAAAQKVYWSDRGTDELKRANLDGTDEETIAVGFGVDVREIAIDPARGHIYAGDTGAAMLGGKKIFRINMEDGSNKVDIIATGVDFPSGIALDLINDKMYWTDFGPAEDEIERSNLDGTAREVLVDMDLISPVRIALDIAGGKMYWPDQGQQNIKRADLNGDNVEPLIEVGLLGPLGIALDVAAGKMYWTESANDIVKRANLDGSGVEDLVEDVDNPRSIALDIAGGKMYYPIQVDDKIQRFNIDKTGVPEDIIFGIAIPDSLALDLDGFDIFERLLFEKEFGGGIAAVGGGEFEFKNPKAGFFQAVQEDLVNHPNLAAALALADLNVLPGSDLLWDFDITSDLQGEGFDITIKAGDIPFGLALADVRFLHVTNFATGAFEILVPDNINLGNNTVTVFSLTASGFGLVVNPEPTTILLLGSALMGLFPFRKRFF